MDSRATKVKVASLGLLENRAVKAPKELPVTREAEERKVPEVM